MRLRLTLLFCALMAIPGLAAAQQSTNYWISDSVFNNGSSLSEPVLPSSPGFRISLDSIGDMAGTSEAQSQGFQLQGSFVAAYRSPGEVLGLDFLNKTTILWLPEPSVGDYSLYRGDVAPVDLASAGLCLATSIPETLIYEPFDPATGQAWFYLVTASNRLNEEGTKGYRSDGAERPNTGPCP